MKTFLPKEAEALGLAVLAFAIAVSARAESPKDRYDVILERKPFGATTADMARTDAKPTASFADSMRLSAIYEMNSGHWVGLIDMQSNRSLTLAVGQSDSGVELVSVDLAKEEAVIRKNGETGLLRLESGAPSAGNSSAPPTPGRPVLSGVPQPAVQNVGTVSPAMNAEQLQNRRKKLLAELRERIESQRAAQAQGNTAPAGSTTRTMLISTPGGGRGQVTISSSGGVAGEVTLEVNGEAVKLSE